MAPTSYRVAPGRSFLARSDCFSRSYVPSHALMIPDPKIHRPPRSGPIKTGMTADLGIKRNGRRTRRPRGRVCEKADITEVALRILSLGWRTRAQIYAKKRNAGCWMAQLKGRGWPPWSGDARGPVRNLGCHRLCSPPGAIGCIDDSARPGCIDGSARPARRRTSHRLPTKSVCAHWDDKSRSSFTRGTPMIIHVVCPRMVRSLPERFVGILGRAHGR